MSLSIVASLLLLSANLYSQENLTTLPATQTPNAVSFSAGTYTFPEIAAKLSQGKVIVTCAKSIRNHAAVVSLKARTLPNAMKILAKGLDLQFRQNDNSGKSFTMEWDPKVIAREKPWLEHLAGNFFKSNDKYLKGINIPASLPQAAIVDKVILLSTQLKRLEDADPKHTLFATQEAYKEHMAWLDLTVIPDWLAHQLRSRITQKDILNAILSDQPIVPIPIASLSDRNALIRIANFMTF